MSLDSSGFEVLPAEEDCVFSNSPACFLGLAVCNRKHHQTRKHEKEYKGRQKRFRPNRFESFKSPPHKRQFCVDAKSPCQMPVNMAFDCFFLTTPKKHHKPPVKRTFWLKRKPSDACFVVRSKEMKMFFKLTGKGFTHLLKNI